ncbi:hypothetical protein BDW69DRAFT_182619 [Aspergillus filifer]
MLRRKGRSNPAADAVFAARRHRTVRPSNEQKRIFYDMTKSIGRNLVKETGILEVGHNTKPFRALDLCTAPGGFSATVIGRIPNAHIDGLILSPELGGYDVLAENACRKIKYADITMYTAEMDVDLNAHIPRDHPDHTRFLTDRPFVEPKYDLIFCGGSISKEQEREEYRSADCEGSRLTLAQLVFALHRLRSGKSLVLLMHRIDFWGSASMTYLISRFAEIQTFKSLKAHGVTSSFYLVAKSIDVHSDGAMQATRYRKAYWMYLALGEFMDIKRVPFVDSVQAEEMDANGEGRECQSL